MFQEFMLKVISILSALKNADECKKEVISFRKEGGPISDSVIAGIVLNTFRELLAKGFKPSYDRKELWTLAKNGLFLKETGGLLLEELGSWAVETGIWKDSTKVQALAVKTPMQKIINLIQDPFLDYLEKAGNLELVEAYNKALPLLALGFSIVMADVEEECPNASEAEKLIGVVTRVMCLAADGMEKGKEKEKEGVKAPAPAPKPKTQPKEAYRPKWMTDEIRNELDRLIDPNYILDGGSTAIEACSIACHFGGTVDQLFKLVNDINDQVLNKAA